MGGQGLYSNIIDSITFFDNDDQTTRHRYIIFCNLLIIIHQILMPSVSLPWQTIVISYLSTKP